jgi:shikimate dehydrogenase
MTRLVGIFGHPLSHSLSPAIQQAAFDYHKIDALYQAWPTSPEELALEVAKLRGKLYLGANVTIPHKVKVMQQLDSIDKMAMDIGAVNTIVKENRTLVGYNTDAYGFIKSLKEGSGIDPSRKRALLLGAGGAARAAAYALAQEGVARITIANRTLNRAVSLSDEIRLILSDVLAISTDGSDLLKAASSADIIVNSTSMGMRHSEAEGQSLLHSEAIPASAVVYDMVYNPSETPLISEARQAGAIVVGGLGMLIHQGAAAFLKWTGKDAPIDIMMEAGEKALSQIASN